MAIFYLLLGVLLAATSTIGVARADSDHIVQRDVLEDAQGTLSIADVVGKAFSPQTPTLSRGYTKSVFWLRLKVRAEPDEQLILRIRPTYLDTVALYEADPANPGAWRTRVTGDRTPMSARDLVSTSLGFSIRPMAPETTYYLRLSTTSASLLRVEALAPPVAALYNLHLDLVEILVLACTLFMLFWAINDYFLHPNAVVGLFAIYQFCTLASAILTMGYGAAIDPNAYPGLIDSVTSFAVCVSTVAALLLNRALIGTFDPPLPVMRLIDLYLAVAVGAVTLLALGFANEALRLNATLLLVLVLSFPVFSFTTRKNAPPGRAALRLSYCLQALAILVILTPLLGIGGPAAWGVDANWAPGLAAGVPVFLLLHLRSRRALIAGTKAEVDLALTQLQLELERHQFDIQNRITATLAHELRTPLSVLRMAVGAARVDGERRKLIDRAIGDMIGIIELSNYADRLDREQLDVRTTRTELVAIVEEAINRSAAPHRLQLAVRPLPPIMTDSQLVGVAMSNLIDNALKYSPEDSVVVVSLDAARRASQDGVNVMIENDPGRAGRPDAARVFQKFYRSPLARGKSGSGLGLYIVKGVSGLLGGEVGYSVIEGKVRFDLWLPC